MSDRVFVPARQAGNLFLGFLKRLINSGSGVRNFAFMNDKGGTAYTHEKTKGSGAQELVIILFILAIWLYSLYRLDEL
jgi:hypothetical protein